MLPCKDAVEKLVLARGESMSEIQNILCTFLFSLFCFICSVTIKDISEVITITGATANTVVGFILPSLFYLRLDTIERGGSLNIYRFLAYLTIVVMTAVSAKVLYTFFTSE